MREQNESIVFTIKKKTVCVCPKIFRRGENVQSTWRQFRTCTISCIINVIIYYSNRNNISIRFFRTIPKSQLIATGV